MRTRNTFTTIALTILLTAFTAPAATILIEAESFDTLGGWMIDQQFMDQMGSPILLAHGLGIPVPDATTQVQLPAPGRYRIFARTRDWVANWNAPGAPGKFQIRIDNQPLPTTFGTEGAHWHWQQGGSIQLDKRSVTLTLHDLTGFEGRCDAILLTTDEQLTPPDNGPALAQLRRKLLNLPDTPRSARPQNRSTGILPVSKTATPRVAGILPARVEGVSPSNPRQARPERSERNARDTSNTTSSHQDRVNPRESVSEENSKFDLVVVGGGMAGCCTAVSAARLGLQVALIQDRPVLGGNNSSEPRVHLGGETNLPPYPRIGDIVKELDPGHQGNAQPAEFYGDDKKLSVIQAEANITLFLNTHANKVETADNRIVSVTASNIRTSEELRFEAPLFADCTGDGTIGFLAGADYRTGRESRTETGESMAPEEPDDMTMGASAMWYSKDTAAPSPFPECPWALQFTEETCQRATRGEWNWECGLGWDQIDEFEAVRDHALRAIYGNWAFQKNHAKDKAKYANLQLDWVAHIAGKRESRRLLGDVILQQQDIQDRTRFADAIVTTTWSIDLHFPQPANSQQFPGMEFRTVCTQPAIKPYPIPYRCLYSRNIDNLFMAGRHISVTHVALGTVRVMRTTGMMGEAVGMAAAVCKTQNTTPRGVFKQHLPELITLAQKGTGKTTER